MTAQFHEGQDVEVWDATPPNNGPVGNWQPGRVFYVGPAGWRKAKIVSPNEKFFVEVQFSDGSRSVVGAEHIRAADPRDEVFPRAPKTSEAEYRTMLAGDSAEEYSGLAEPDDDTSDPMGRIP